MPVGAKARVRGAALGAFRRAFRDGVRNALDDWGDAVLAESQKRVPTGATIGLKESGHTDPAEPTYWKLVEYTAPYALFVHDGTRPHWPPPGVLLRWVELVLGVTGQEAKRVEFLVARHIAQFGTKPQPFLRDAVQAVEPKLEGYFRKHLGKAFDAIELQVSKV